MTVLSRDWENANKREKHKFLFMNFDLFVTVRLLDETPAVLLLNTLCSKHGYSFEWKIGVTPRLANSGKTITCIMDNFALLVVPRLSSVRAAVCLQHQGQRISKIIPENWDYYQIQSRLKVTNMHAGNRCGQILTSKPRETWTSTQKIFRREGSNARHSRLVTALHRKSIGPRDACARTSLWKRDLIFGKWCLKSGNTKTEAQYLYSLPKDLNRDICLRTKITRVPCRRRNEGSIEQESLVTW